MKLYKSTIILTATLAFFNIYSAGPAEHGQQTYAELIAQQRELQIYKPELNPFYDTEQFTWEREKPLGIDYAAHYINGFLNRWFCFHGDYADAFKTALKSIPNQKLNNSFLIRISNEIYRQTREISSVCRVEYIRNLNTIWLNAIPSHNETKQRDSFFESLNTDLVRQTQKTIEDIAVKEILNAASAMKEE